MSTDAPRIHLIGSGAVAHALAEGLLEAGWQVFAWARRPGAAPGEPSQHVELEAFATAERIVIAVTDGAIGSVAEDLARAVGECTGSGAVLHTSGYHDRHILDPLARRGWSTGSLHPLRAVPPRASGTPASLVGAWFACEGDARALGAGRRVVRALGGREFPLPAEPSEPGGPGAKARYHAAATLVAAGSVALLDAAASLVAGAAEAPSDAERRARREAFAELARGALANASEGEPSAALTGPHARGDAAVVAGHLELLRSLEGAPVGLYLEVARYAASLARARGVLDAAAQARLDALLD